MYIYKGCVCMYVWMYTPHPALCVRIEQNINYIRSPIERKNERERERERE